MPENQQFLHHQKSPKKSHASHDVFPHMIKQHFKNLFYPPCKDRGQSPLPLVKKHGSLPSHRTWDLAIAIFRAPLLPDLPDVFAKYSEVGCLAGLVIGTVVSKLVYLFQLCFYGT